MMEISPQKEKIRRQQIAEEIYDLQHPQITIKQPKFRRADTCWQQNHIPKNVPCRQKEKDFIEEFIKQGIEKKGSKESLYISGVPGIGKTITVKEVLSKFKDDDCFKERFVSGYINALKLTKQTDIYKTIYNMIFKHNPLKANEKGTAIYVLDQLFRKGIVNEKNKGSRTIEKTKILIIDQIDYLDTKSHDVIYNIFDWTQYKLSKLVIIAISNTISFPETLTEKIMSRIGDRRLIFQPYSVASMEKILMSRIEELPDNDIIEDKGIQFICKKVTKSSSDVRKILQMLRQAIFLHQSKFKGSKAAFARSRISFETLIEAYECIFGDSLRGNIEEMPQPYQKILRIIASHYRNYYRSIRLAEVEENAQRLFEQPINKFQVKEIIVCLRDMGIIALKQKRAIKKDKNHYHLGTNQDLIELLVLVESLLYPLQVV